MRKLSILMVVLLAGIASQAQAFYDTKTNSVNEGKDNDRLTKQIREQLQDNIAPQHTLKYIQVRATEDGAVHLRGKVASYQARAAIERQARLAPGVVRVHNDISVR